VVAVRSSQSEFLFPSRISGFVMCSRLLFGFAFDSDCHEWVWIEPKGSSWKVGDVYIWKWGNVQSPTDKSLCDRLEKFTSNVDSHTTRRGQWMGQRGDRHVAWGDAFVPVLRRDLPNLPTRQSTSFSGPRPRIVRIVCFS
jgi:hypothetical protein